MKNLLAVFFAAVFLCGCIPVYKPWKGDVYCTYSANSAIGVSMGLEESAFRALINGDKNRKKAGLNHLLPQEKLLFNSNAAIYYFYKDLTFEELKQAVKKYEPQDEDFFLAYFSVYEYNFLGSFLSGTWKEGKGFECFEAKIAKRFFFDGDVLYLSSCCPGVVERFFKFEKRGDGAWELIAETDIFYSEDLKAVIEYDTKNIETPARFYPCQKPNYVNQIFMENDDRYRGRRWHNDGDWN